MLVGPAVSRRLLRPLARNLPVSSHRGRPQSPLVLSLPSHRTYASATGTAKKASSDLPWLIAAAVVTVPSVFYALQTNTKGHDAQGEHTHSNIEHVDEEAEKSTKSTSHGEATADQTSSGEEARSNASGSNQIEGIGFAGGSKKLEPDAKGATKKRIDSDLAKNIGEGVSSATEDDMSRKQRGLTNTDTRHSTDISQDPGKSKKGEGTAETAKVKGTVSPDRPQV